MTTTSQERMAELTRVERELVIEHTQLSDQLNAARAVVRDLEQRTARVYRRYSEALVERRSLMDEAQTARLYRERGG